jgi:hypothetical protein
MNHPSRQSHPSRRSGSPGLAVDSIRLRLRRPLTFALAALATLAVALPAAGQFNGNGNGNGKPPTSSRIPPVEPKWLRFDLKEVDLGLYSEGQYENSTYQNSGSQVKYQRYFLGPLIGLNGSGSIYHPNFLSLAINGEGSYGRTWTTIESGGVKTTQNENDFLGNLAASGTFLQEKPYATTAFINWDHTTRSYDFYNQLTVDSKRYGVNTGYRGEDFTLGGAYWHRDEESYGYQQHTVSHEDLATANANWVRATGSSALNYSYDQFTRLDLGQYATGVDQGVSASDTETFGNRGQYRLNANGSYWSRDNSELPSDQWIAYANLDADHTDILRSRYQFNFDQYNTTDYVSHNYLGHAELEHQLYESLTSTLIAEGTAFNFTQSPSASQQTTFTGGFSEAYVKRLSESSTLRVDNTFLLSHTTVDNTGTLIVVYDEGHSLNGGGGAPPGSFFLNRPLVLQNSIVVTDLQNTVPPYQEGLDYLVQRVGIQTMIQRLAGSRIPVNGSVLVDYDALASPSGSYGSINETFRVRVSLFNEVWGLYGRVNLWLNNAPPELFVQDIHSYAVGTDLQYKWLRAGAEMGIYDATLSRYNALAFYQGALWDIDGSSNFGINFNQILTRYFDPSNEDNLYDFILRYNKLMSYHLSGHIEGGVSLRRGTQNEQTIAAFRPGLEYRRGKTTIRAYYTFEHRLYLDQELQNNQTFMISFKRAL